MNKDYHKRRILRNLTINTFYSGCMP